MMEPLIQLHNIDSRQQSVNQLPNITMSSASNASKIFPGDETIIENPEL